MTHDTHLQLRLARERHAERLRAAARRRLVRASLPPVAPRPRAATARRALARLLRAWAGRLDPERTGGTIRVGVDI